MKFSGRMIDFLVMDGIKLPINLSGISRRQNKCAASAC